jgi:hypothetical protein
MPELQETEVTGQDLLELRYVPLSQAVLWDRNPKEHDIGGLTASIEKYGFRDPPAYDAALGAFVEGNGRIITLRMMHEQGHALPRGLAQVQDTGEWAVPVLFGVDAQSKAVAEAYAVDHNNLTMLGGEFAPWQVARMWRGDDYNALLQDLAQQSQLPVSVDGDDLDALLAISEREREAVRKVAAAMASEVNSPRVLGSSGIVKVLVHSKDVPAFERAIALSGERNRADALGDIVSFYLEQRGGDTEG